MSLLDTMTPAEQRAAANGKKKKAKGYKRHELSACYPAMSGEKLAKMAASIKKNEQQHPIEIYKGEILDGWNRYLACKLAKVEPWTADVTDELRDKNLAEYVLSSNGLRRHLTATELAIAAAKLSETKWYVENAKVSQNKGSEGGSGSGEPKVSQKATVQAAKAVGATPAGAKRAAKVLKDGAKATVEALEDKKITLTTAAKIASKPKSEQAAAVEAAVKPKAKNGVTKRALFKTCETAFGTLYRTALKLGIDDKKFGPHFNAIIDAINKLGGKG